MHQNVSTYLQLVVELISEHDGSNKILYSTTQKSKTYSCKLAYTGQQNLRFN